LLGFGLGGFGGGGECFGHMTSFDFSINVSRAAG
jgi:hypothetical protein